MIPFFSISEQLLWSSRRTLCSKSKMYIVCSLQYRKPTPLDRRFNNCLLVKDCVHDYPCSLHLSDFPPYQSISLDRIHTLEVLEILSFLRWLPSSSTVAVEKGSRCSCESDFVSISSQIFPLSYQFFAAGCS